MSGKTAQEPLAMIPKTDIPNPSLYRIDKTNAKLSAMKLHVLLSLAIEAWLDESRSAYYRKYCVVLAILCAESLSSNLKHQYSSHDPHHQNSYARIGRILNKSLSMMPSSPRLARDKRLPYSQLSDLGKHTNSLNKIIFEFCYHSKQFM